MENIIEILEFFFRIVLAGICGCFIGYERKNRGKEAGIRTHTIVAMASALIMIISKYGFSDLAMGADLKFDGSRVASQIVSGIGFLGAGMIFVEKRSVRGLTTAAGVWATSGVGMAIGSGLYILGVLTAGAIFVVQILTHKRWRFFKSHNDEHIVFRIESSDEAVSYLKDYIENRGIAVTEMNVVKINEAMLEVEVSATLPNNCNMLELLDYNREYILSVSI